MQALVDIFPNAQHRILEGQVHGSKKIPTGCRSDGNAFD
jgi:hypothetical protein